MIRLPNFAQQAAFTSIITTFVWESSKWNIQNTRQKNNKIAVIQYDKQSWSSVETFTKSWFLPILTMQNPTYLLR